MSARHTTAQIEEALIRKYASPQWATLLQVRNTTGYAAKKVRTADALSFSLWPSRGLELHGFEIKSLKSDLKRELLDPAKAEDIAQFCDYWWLVVLKGICDLDEVPTNWGVLEFDAGELKAIKPAIKLQAQPLNVPMVAGIMRKASETMMPLTQVEAEVSRRVEQRRTGLDDELEHERRWHKDLKAKVAAFEKASGLKIDRWNPLGTAGEIGEAVKVVMSSGINLAKQDRDLQRTMADLQTIMDELEKLRSTLPKAARQIAKARASMATTTQEGTSDA